MAIQQPMSLCERFLLLFYGYRLPDNFPAPNLVIQISILIQSMIQSIATFLSAIQPNLGPMRAFFNRVICIPTQRTWESLSRRAKIVLTITFILDVALIILLIVLVKIQIQQDASQLETSTITQN